MAIALTHSIDADVTSAHVSQIPGRCAGIQSRHALQSGIGADTMQVQQQALLQHSTAHGFVGRRAFQCVGEVQPQVSFFRETPIKSVHIELVEMRSL